MVRCPLCLEELQYQTPAWRSFTPRSGGYYSHVLDVAMLWPDSDPDLHVDICPINHMAWWVPCVARSVHAWAYLDTAPSGWIGAARITDILGITSRKE